MDVDMIHSLEKQLPNAWHTKDREKRENELKLAVYYDYCNKYMTSKVETNT